jgi:hypothetical protein
VDGGEAEDRDGVLIYTKPAFYCDGKEPLDVFNYAAASVTFPHETTADQWFSESQFESYRMLGRYTITEVLRDIQMSAAGNVTLRAFLMGAQLPPTPATTGHEEAEAETGGDGRKRETAG